MRHSSPEEPTNGGGAADGHPLWQTGTSFCVTLGAKGVVTAVTELKLSLKVIKGEMTLDILGGPNVITRVLTREKQEGQRVRR